MLLITFKWQLVLVVGFMFASVKTDENQTTAKFTDNAINLEVYQSRTTSVSLLSPFEVNENITYRALYITYQRGTNQPIFKNESLLGEYVITPIPDIIVNGSSVGPFIFNVTARIVGTVYLGINSTDIGFRSVKSAYCKVVIIRSNKVKIICDIIGWIYFVAWTVSFYPQVILNFYKKSVIGLNFDFVLFNWLGFFSYSAFNVALHWVPSIEDIFKQLYPRSVNPVQLNDVIFGLHALVIVTVQIFQCIFLERGEQKVSKIGCGLFAGMLVYIVVIVSVAGSKTPHFNWLDFLYYLSYLKLFITIIKYIPQAFMNFKRKSTVGWSIWNVLLDFTGGTFSILQMIILAYNNDDWKGFFSDPTKFGLGLFSVLFDVLFMVQHYVLYRHPKSESYEILEEQSLHYVS